MVRFVVTITYHRRDMGTRSEPTWRRAETWRWRSKWLIKTVKTKLRWHRWIHAINLNYYIHQICLKFQNCSSVFTLCLRSVLLLCCKLILIQGLQQKLGYICVSGHGLRLMSFRLSYHCFVFWLYFQAVPVFHITHQYPPVVPLRPLPWYPFCPLQSQIPHRRFFFSSNFFSSSLIFSSRAFIWSEIK